MKMNIVLSVVGLFVMELNVTGVTGQITNPPQNAVVEVGGQTILNCTSDTNLQNWFFSRTRDVFENASAQRIVLNCDVQSGFTAHYEVDRPGASDKKCNLIIKAATMQQAGVYTCNDIQNGPSAILAVIARDASITVDSQPETAEGETVTMSYAVQYNTSTASSRTPTIQPLLSWIDSDGNGVTGSVSSTANAVTSSISVTAGRQDIRPYTCRTSYKIIYPPSSTGLPFADNILTAASNPPSTSAINVLYAPIVSSIDMSEEVPVCPGKKVVTLTCLATANPPPTYSWVGTDSIYYTGTTIEVDMNGAYSCNATNVIRGTTRSDTKERMLNNVVSNNSCEVATEVETKGNSISTAAIAAIVLGSFLAFSIAVNLSLIVVLMRNRSQPTSGLKARTSNIEQHIELQQVQNKRNEPDLPPVYEDLSQTGDEQTIYTQLSS